MTSSVAVQEVVRNVGGYPPRLQHLSDPPFKLYCQGDLSLLQAQPAVAVVGTRRATAYGLNVARRLGKFLAQQGITVISGLARGIDGAAHRGCLEVSGGQALAVIGCGLDQAYPVEHAALQKTIGERGLVISEYPPGSLPLSYHFPQRNRIVAALCHVLVVVEAPLKSGALLSVNHAINLGREVLVVPGPLWNPACLGNLRLLKDGAAPLVEFSDILDILEGTGVCPTAGAWSIEPATPAATSSRLAKLLSSAGSTLEELCLALNLKPEDILPSLLCGELEGQLKRVGQRYYPVEDG